jgi:uncharacterized membrane protein
MPGVRVLGERLRSRLWPIPALAATLAAILAAALSTLRPESTAGLLWWPGEAASARGLLEVLAGSSLTVVALVFSLHVVALQLAASQYSPRLLRTYARDVVVQLSLAVLIATFVFSLVTLALFGSADRPPRISVVVAVALGLGSVAALVGVVAHIVSSLRVETMMAELHADASAVIRQAYQTADDGAPAYRTNAPIRRERHPFRAARSGFVQAIDHAHLVRWATRHDVVVVVDVSPGTHVLSGQALGWADASTDGAEAELSPAVLIGHERTPDEDPGFGMLQLVDISLRALSPGINDPTTALHAVGHLTSLLLEIAALHPASVTTTPDEDGNPRVVQARPTLGDHLEDTCRPLVRAGASDPQILLAIARLLTAVGPLADASETPAIHRTAAYVEGAADRSIADQSDLATIRDALAAFTES